MSIVSGRTGRSQENAKGTNVWADPVLPSAGHMTWTYSLPLWAALYSSVQMEKLTFL